MRVMGDPRDESARIVPVDEARPSRAHGDSAWTHSVLIRDSGNFSPLVDAGCATRGRDHERSLTLV